MRKDELSANATELWKTCSLKEEKQKTSENSVLFRQCSLVQRAQRDLFMSRPLEFEKPETLICISRRYSRPTPTLSCLTRRRPESQKSN